MPLKKLKSSCLPQPVLTLQAPVNSFLYLCATSLLFQPPQKYNNCNTWNRSNFYPYSITYGVTTGGKNIVTNTFTKSESHINSIQSYTCLKPTTIPSSALPPLTLLKNSYGIPRLILILFSYEWSITDHLHPLVTPVLPINDWCSHVSTTFTKT